MKEDDEGVEPIGGGIAASNLLRMAQMLDDAPTRQRAERTLAGFVPRLQSSAYYQCAGQAWNDAQPQIDRAIARARDIASNGQSSIAAAAITFSVR